MFFKQIVVIPSEKDTRTTFYVGIPFVFNKFINAIRANKIRIHFAVTSSAINLLVFVDVYPSYKFYCIFKKSIKSGQDVAKEKWTFEYFVNPGWLSDFFA